MKCGKLSSPHTYFQNLVCIIFQESKLIKSISLSPNLGRLQFSHLAVSDSLQPHGLQYARLPCPPLTSGACSHSCPSSRWCPPTVSSSVVPFSSFNLSQHQGLFQWVASSHQMAKVLEFQLQHQSFQFKTDFFLGWTGWISLQSKGLSRVFSNTIVQKHQFFSTQLSLESNSHICTRLLEKSWWETWHSSNQESLLKTMLCGIWG